MLAAGAGGGLFGLFFSLAQYISFPPFSRRRSDRKPFNSKTRSHEKQIHVSADWSDSLCVQADLNFCRLHMQ